jgi:hypothetical protein
LQWKLKTFKQKNLLVTTCLNTEKPKEEEFDIEGIDKLTQDILNLI